MANTLKFGNGEWYGKKDTILAYNDENSNYKPLPFNFSRASKATVINKDGLIEEVGSGIPRIDYKDNSKGALLLEPSRTNYLPKSIRLDQWSSASNATVEYGFPDPFGGSQAVKATSSTTAQAYQIYWGFTSANTYNLSVYAKKGTAKIFRIDFAIPDNGYFLVNLETGESAGTSGFSGMINTKIEPLDNDWYRISLTSTTVNPNYVRMGANNQEGFLYMAFAQVEVGTYPTSYIPTQGSVVTRLADSCSQTTPDGVIGQTEGTLFLDVNISHIVGSEAIGGINSGGYANHVTINRVGNTIQFVRNSATQSGVMVLSSSAITVGSFKLAIAYKSGDTACFLNGTQVSTTQTQTFTNGTLNLVRISGDAIGSIPFADTYNQVKLYNTRLSNSELAALTQV